MSGGLTALPGCSRALGSAPTPPHVPRQPSPLTLPEPTRPRALPFKAPAGPGPGRTLSGGRLGPERGLPGAARPHKAGSARRRREPRPPPRGAPFAERLTPGPAAGAARCPAPVKLL